MCMSLLDARNRGCRAGEMAGEQTVRYRRELKFGGGWGKVDIDGHWCAARYAILDGKVLTEV